MSINTADLANMGDGLLDPNTYDWKVVDARMSEWEKEDVQCSGLGVTFECTGGPAQEDGSDPAGTEAQDFFQVEGTETHADGGKFARKRLKQFLTAVLGEISGDDVDENDLKGEEFQARVAQGTDRDGDPAIDFKKYMPA